MTMSRLGNPKDDARKQSALDAVDGSSTWRANLGSVVERAFKVRLLLVADTVAKVFLHR